MKILGIQVLKGPNIWSAKRRKLIQMRLDLEELEQWPTNKIEGFRERIEKLIPSLITHRCSPGYEGGLFERVDEGTWMGHVIEHIALELQTLAGTVGCVALDKNGNIAAATSTGGKGFEIPGRVSDSATVAGNYANSFAGISCTGVGEDIVSAGLSVKIVTRVTDGMSLEEASRKSFDEMKLYDGFAGIIGITANGEIYHCDSHPYMVWASFDKQVSVFD